MPSPKPEHAVGAVSANNPGKHADRRHEPEASPLAFYSPEQVEGLARALADGAHRDPRRPALSPSEIDARAREDVQDAELIRVAAYAGLRRGELVALRWRDVDLVGRKIIVRRSLSAETELRSTKSGRARKVPLPDQAAAALERLSRRGEFTGPDGRYRGSAHSRPEFARSVTPRCAPCFEAGALGGAKWLDRRRKR
jgi:integrase